MIDTNTDRSNLDADATLRHIRAMQASAQRAEVAILEDAAHWADLHGVLEPTGFGLPGVEQMLPLGGDGTPEVSRVLPRRTRRRTRHLPNSAARLIGDALDLRHRLPQLWTRIQAGEVKPWIGRQIATDTRDLSLETVTVVDRRVAKYAHSLTWGRLAKVVQAAIIDTDPDYARQREESHRRNRGVWLNPADNTGTITGAFAAAGPDALRFDAGLNRTADALGPLGDTDTKEVRRSKALGILANPQLTMDLYATAETRHDHVDPDDQPADRDPISTSTTTDQSDPDPISTSTISEIGGNPAPFVRGVSIKVDPRPKAVLYVHLTKESLEQDEGVARVEGIGPVTLDQAKQWLGDCTVAIKPVIDLAGIAPVDAYETPDPMREAVHLMSPADTFPYASCLSRKMDLDHTIPYVHPDDGGPPGQTGIGKLGPLTRHHHRIKTHSRWQVKQPFPGIYLWRSPHGRHWLVDHTGTHRLSA